MHTALKFRCPHCGVRLAAREEQAGRGYGCPKCTAMVTVPSPQVPSSTTNGLMVLDDDSSAVPMPHSPSQVPTSTTPVELKLPGNLGGMKANVDQETSNTLAKTFIGGALVVTGVMLQSWLGGGGKRWS